MKWIAKKSSDSLADSIIIPFFLDEVKDDIIFTYSAIKQKIDFKGNLKEVQVLYPSDQSRKVFLLGLGKRTDTATHATAFRTLAATKNALWGSALSVELSHLPVQTAFDAALGIALATYKPNGLKTDEPTKADFYSEKFELTLHHPDKRATELAKEGIATAAVQKEMMYLIDLPSNIKTPGYLCSYIQSLSKKKNFDVKIFDQKQLEKMGMHALLAVGQGSINAPAMVQLTYEGLKSKTKTTTIGLVGKGITFDTGGISIKSAANMHYMKSDMGGAASVLGAIMLAASLQLPVNLCGVLLLAENSVDAHSMRPGDVIKSYSGKTIEVIDTDAEGRLVLADGLAYLNKTYKPDTLIDLATLTGSCVMTLGYAAAGMFTNNQELAAGLSRAGNATGERVWQLPLWDVYKSDIESDVADVRNFSGKPVSGAISAAKFLEVFTDNHPAWCHLDIAGVAFGDSEFTKMKSATGWGARLLVEWMRDIHGTAP